MPNRTQSRSLKVWLEQIAKLFARDGRVSVLTFVAQYGGKPDSVAQKFDALRKMGITLFDHRAEWDDRPSTSKRLSADDRSALIATTNTLLSRLNAQTQGVGDAGETTFDDMRIADEDESDEYESDEYESDEYESDE